MFDDASATTTEPPGSGISTKRPRERDIAPLRGIRRLVTSNYDLTSHCNLRCEGCLYFAGDDYLRYQENDSTAAWDAFFRAEAERGVNFAYLAGAEPSLVPERLRAANRHIASGVIKTNGIRHIDAAIRYRIHISMWGDDSSALSYRGANVNRKALSNYAGDDRAVVVYTINALNIDEMPNAVAACAAAGLPVTFSYFSPTEDYLRRLRRHAGNDGEFFRFSRPEENMRLTRADFPRARAAIEASIESHPETIVYSLAFDDWVTQAGGLYQLDPSGVATDCGNRLSANHRHINADMSQSRQKCCSPNIACSECRAYSMSYATYLRRHVGSLRKPRQAQTWLEVWRIWSRLFLLDEPAAREAGAA